MRALVLSCGPSLDNFDGDTSGYDMVIGVNGVVAKYQLDWWVMGDDETARDMLEHLKAGKARRGFYKRSIPSHSESYMAEERDVTEKLPHLIWHHLDLHQLVRRLQYSGQAALFLAWILRADEVDVWGMDLEGDGGFGGEHDPDIRKTHRTEKRWDVERNFVEIVLQLYRRDGIKVNFKH